jgi:hypothetical protein
MMTATTSSVGRWLGDAAWLAAVLALAGHVGFVAAQERPTEQSVRAAMTFNFMKFTEFPPENLPDQQRLRLCISVGDPSQAEALGALAGRKIWNRELVVRRLGERDLSCQVLFVDSRQRWNAALESRSLGAALTVGSYRGFVQDGGMIEIDMESSGNRFEINLAQVRGAHFHMSPQLLRLARQIHD